MHSTCRAMLVVLLALFTCAAASRGQSGPFDSARGKASLVIVTRSVEAPDVTDLSPRAEMLDVLAGVLARVSTTTEIDALRRAGGPFVTLTPDEESRLTRIGIAHMFASDTATRGTAAPAAASHRSVELLRDPNGAVFVREVKTASGSEKNKAPARRVQRLKPEVISPLLLRVSRFPENASAFAPASPGSAEAALKAQPAAREEPLKSPLVPGAYTFTNIFMSERMQGGGRVGLADTARDLAKETIVWRIPARWDRTIAAPVIAWIGADNEPHLPAQLFRTCDERGIILVGAANAGNNRVAQDRDQLTFDALATVSSRVLIDPNRVYITGISGGGRICSILAMSFPEVFTGSIPIVGLSCYQNVPVGSSAFPAGFGRPGKAAFTLLKSRRIAPITGDKDFNLLEINAASAVLKRDGLQVRVFSYTDMQHEMPTPERFLEAFDWVDEPARAARSDAVKSATELMTTLRSRRKDSTKPLTDADRTELLSIIDRAPWTTTAWDACRELGVLAQSTGSARPPGASTP
jgi:hypothetical protein